MTNSLRGQKRHDKEGLERLQFLEGSKGKNAALEKAFREAQAWNEDQFKQWSEVQAKKEEDNIALQMYRRKDEAILKQMSVELQR